MTDLDRWLAESVMGWELYDPSPEFNDGLDHSSWTMKEHKLWYKPTSDWHPSSDLNQAFLCVEKMREMGWGFMLETPEKSSGYEASFIQVINDLLYEAQDPNPALAICKAIKAALSNAKDEPK